MQRRHFGLTGPTGLVVIALVGFSPAAGASSFSPGSSAASAATSSAVQSAIQTTRDDVSRRQLWHNTRARVGCQKDSTPAFLKKLFGWGSSGCR
jgi:hypothetical protein